MCGIVGYVGPDSAKEIVYRGLKRLEYRGYDSAGIAVQEKNKTSIVKRPGKLQNLRDVWDELSVSATLAIGHTRWATHGEPNRANAHPHQVGTVTVVQNGIIENYNQLKQEILSQGSQFTSDTDTEVFAHLVQLQRAAGVSLVEAVRTSFARLKGGSAFVVIDETMPGTIVAIRRDSPLVVGIGEKESLVGSDVQAIVESTRNVYYLKDNEMVVLNADGVKVFDEAGKEVSLHIDTIDWSLDSIDKSGFDHFMLKEIHEQPEAIRATLAPFLETSTNSIQIHAEKKTGEEVLALLAGSRMTHFIACGTASYASQYAANIFERIANTRARAELASEFRYREPFLDASDVGVLVSQSGETADTLAALRMMKQKKIPVIAVCNVRDSTIARDADAVFYTNAGFEISVASTKAFTTQLAVLASLAANLAKYKGLLKDEAVWAKELKALPGYFEDVLANKEGIAALAKQYFDKKVYLFLGRAEFYMMALEGALKLKEIAYVHAEGYPAGELKHGPIAMVDEDTLVLAIAPELGESNSVLQEKTVSNVEEVRARKAVLLGIGAQADKHFQSICNSFIAVPQSSLLAITAITSILPLQLFAYYIALEKGTDIDQPRNLAKSVTVE